jgi:hypothetical protein
MNTHLLLILRVASSKWLLIKTAFEANPHPIKIDSGLNLLP